MRIKLRSDAYFQGEKVELNIDRDNMVIRNLVAMESNQEALGHGFMTDLKSLYMIEALSNADPKGLSARFGHPGMSENATGKKLGITRNYRVVDGRLQNDLYLMEAARKSPAFTQDPIEYLFLMAEQYPGELGQSMVIDTDVVWIFEDGHEESALDDEEFFYDSDPPEGATTLLPVMRPYAVFNNDIVNDGALTPNGLFTKLSVSGYTEELFDWIDQWRQQFNVPLEDIPRKAQELITKYLAMKGNKELKMPVSKKRKVLDDSPLDDLILGEPVESAEAPVEEAPVEEEDNDVEEGDPLDEALIIAEQTAEDLKDEPEAQTADLTKKVAMLEAKLQKMEKMLTLSAANVQKLAQRVKQLEAEPMVTETVPVPPKTLTAKPVMSVAQRVKPKITGKKPSPVAASLARNIARKQAYGMED